MDKPALARVLPGFETIRRYTNPQGQVIAKLLPGDFYVTTYDEVLDTVLGSCVSACIRNRQARHRRHESFHVAASERQRS